MLKNRQFKDDNQYWSQLQSAEWCKRERGPYSVWMLMGSMSFGGSRMNRSLWARSVSGDRASKFYTVSPITFLFLLLPSLYLTARPTCMCKRILWTDTEGVCSWWMKSWHEMKHQPCFSPLRVLIWRQCCNLLGSYISETYHTCSCSYLLWTKNAVDPRGCTMGRTT